MSPHNPLGWIKRLAGRPAPKAGDLFWVGNEDLGIMDLDTKDHPVVVVTGQNVKGGPVVIAVGSSTRRDTKGHAILTVEPTECQPGSRLDKRTRFWISENQRLPADKLGRAMGAVNEAKLRELKQLRGGII